MTESYFGYRFILIFVIIALNAFFASAEVALLSVRKSRLRHLADSGNVGAQAALDLLENPERLLSVVQVGVTLASLGLGWAGEDTIFGLLTSMLAPFENPAISGILHGVSFTLSFVIMTFAHVVLGEVVPKNLAIEKADSLAVLVAPALLVFYRVTEPFVLVLERSATAISRLIGLRGEQHGGGHSAEELKFIISSSRSEGHLHHFEEVAIQHVLDLQKYSAREIMVPRNAIVSVAMDASLENVLRLFIDHQYSRLPVYFKKPESIIGVVHYKDLIRVWEERKLAIEQGRPTRLFRLRRIMRKPMVIPETKPLNELVDEFRTSHSHMAIVVDEFGTISGLVTLEDVLEQVFGEIEDEHDERRQKPMADGSLLELDGATSIRDLHRQYGVDLPGDAGFETLAGFLLYQFGRIPRTDESVDYEQRRFTILEMDNNRIATVRIDRIQSSESVLLDAESNPEGARE